MASFGPLNTKFIKKKNEVEINEEICLFQSSLDVNRDREASA